MLSFLFTLSKKDRNGASGCDHIKRRTTCRKLGFDLSLAYFKLKLILFREYFNSLVLRDSSKRCKNRIAENNMVDMLTVKHFAIGVNDLICLNVIINCHIDKRYGIEGLELRKKCVEPTPVIKRIEAHKTALAFFFCYCK